MANIALPSGGFILTRGAMNALAKVLSGGSTLTFTRVALGDCNYRNGTITNITDEEAFELTDLVRWKKDLPIVDAPLIDSGVAHLKYQIANADLQEGFWMCETGIFIQDPDDATKEILYAYEFQGLGGGWLPPGGGYHIWEQVMVVAIAIGQAQSVTAIINSGSSYVLPTATRSVKGGVIIGYGLEITEEGVLSRGAGVVLDTIPSTVEGAIWYIPATE